MPINKPLSPLDRVLLESDSEVQWIPEDPQELVLPYVDQTRLTEEEKSDIEKRREKGKEVYDSYTSIIKECEQMQEKIEVRCKNVVVPIEEETQYNVLEALERVFGIGTKEITFEMYRICIEELDSFSSQALPDPENL